MLARSILLFVAVVVALICVAQTRSMPYEFEDYPAESAYRFQQWAEMPHKRVPSAGDMMVRFGKRSI